MSDAIRLLPFQIRASQQIVNRYLKLSEDARRPLVHRDWAVPYYQALSALTGAGKTPILADAVAQIRATTTAQPIVLWISWMRTVVDQTFANMEPGGKYNHLIDPFQVIYLAELTRDMIADGATPFLALTTAGSFNQKSKSDGSLSVHQVKEDDDHTSLWDALTARQTASGERRSLIIVYDEAQNLSDQQTDLLLGLEPDAFLAASATMRTPAKLGRMIGRLRDEGWSLSAEDDTPEHVCSCLITQVSNKAVVDAQLVKQQVVLGGYTSIMETMIDEMLETMEDTRQKAHDAGADFEPKAIYVCRTNFSEDDGSRDSRSKPFAERRATPILIWRYLVEQKGVDPSDIAVYCNLEFDHAAFPPPDDFKLFSGGDSDFAAFSTGDYKHVIFNKKLQEGWDDPTCCFAYIDKAMGSDVQIEQVIGRVLRQPGAAHHPDPALNTATFFIRLDNKQEFPRILKMVKEKLGAEYPGVSIDTYTDSLRQQRVRLVPKAVLTVPEIHIDASEAVGPLGAAVAALHDYRQDAVNTVGAGEAHRVVQAIGGGALLEEEVRTVPHSNRVMARWVLRRGMQSLYPEAAKAIDWAHGSFNARVEITSPAAAELRAAAERLVDTFLENSSLAFEEANPFHTGPVLVNPAKAKPFRNALHERYDLNGLEQQIAEAIDDTGLPWARNPVNGGYSIPLLEKGGTHRFFPDFLVWKEEAVFAVDPKGDQLIKTDAGRKLLNIVGGRGHRGVIVRLISEGHSNDQFQKLSRDGFTVWSLVRASGKVKAKAVSTAAEAVSAALKI